MRVPPWCIALLHHDTAQHRPDCAAVTAHPHHIPVCANSCLPYSEISARRKSQVGTGSRSEKIKTYNYKDSRMSGEGWVLFRLLHR